MRTSIILTELVRRNPFGDKESVEGENGMYVLRVSEAFSNNDTSSPLAFAAPSRFSNLFNLLLPFRFLI